MGLNHEQQHQELLATDIKYILGNNPLFPPYNFPPGKAQYSTQKNNSDPTDNGFIKIEKGIYKIGYKGNDFCFDNELSRHEVLLQNFSIARNLVTNGEFMEFMDAGGYKDFNSLAC